MTYDVPPPANGQPQPTPQQAAVFQLCLKQAADGGRALMEGLVAQARQTLLSRTNDHRNAGLGGGASQTLELLVRYAPSLIDGFPAELALAFTEALHPVPDKTSSSSDLRFDQLELMDDAEVQEKLELARALQSTQSEAEGPLSELNGLISTAQGYRTVQPDRNPLRPASYVNALHRAFLQTGVAADVRLAWLQLTCSELGKRLWDVYTDMGKLLKSAEIVRAPYQVSQAAQAGGAGGYGLGGGASSAFAAQDPQADVDAEAASEPFVPVPGGSRDPRATHLTVRQLRRLLAGEFDQIRQDPTTGAPADFERSDFGPSGFGGSGFEHTVPAALEALEEMQQVDKAMARLAGRRAPMRKRVAQVNVPAQAMAVPPARETYSATELAGLSRHELYEALRGQASGVGQVLGLEVVSLMVENVVKDPGLLSPVQALIQLLEAPLLQLAMVDPRFFNDRQHPARRLLEAIVEQARRFESESHPGFAAFIQPLRTAINDLQHVPIEGPEPFALCLETLRQGWEEHLHKERQQRTQAQNTLRQAEQRNLLAAQIAARVRDRHDVSLVPEAVLAFVTGPWAQAIAKARLAAVSDGEDGTPAISSTEADQYLALVGELFWSVNTDLARADTNRLVKLIPVLLSRLRAGLKLIQYPQAATNEFFEVLMGLHQKALSPKAVAANAASAGAPAVKVILPEEVIWPPTPWPQESPVWLAPNEAQASGFLEDLDLPAIPDTQTQPMMFSPAGVSSVNAVLPQVKAQITDAKSIPLGTWLDITTDTYRMRAELVWASPEGTMFMFTASTGRNQSMTRNSLDRLIQQGRVSVVSAPNVLGTALDAVAQTALLNSVDRPES